MASKKSLNKFLYLSFVMSLLSIVATGRAASVQHVSSRQLLDHAYGLLSNEQLRDSALFYYSVVANRYYAKNPSPDDSNDAVSAMDNMGYMYFFFYFDYQKAYQYMNRALHIAIKENVSAEIPYVYLNLANLFRTYSDINNDHGFDSQVIGYYRRAFRSALKVGKWRASQVAFYGLAHYAYHTGMVDSIMPEMRLLRTTHIPANTPILRVNNYFCGMLDSYRRHDYGSALTSLRQMLVHNDAQDNPFRFEILMREKIVDMLLRMNRRAEAIDELNNAMEMARRNKASDLLAMLLRKASDTYLSFGDTARAADYKLQFYQARERLQDKGRLMSVGRLHFLSEIDHMNEQVQDLNRKRQVQTVVLTAVGVVALMVIVFMIVLLRNYRKLQNAYQWLYNQNVEQLRQNEKEVAENVAKSTKGDSNTPILTDGETEKLRHTIDSVLNDTNEICSLDFSLNRLAELSRQKYWNMSHIIKTLYGKNFNTLLAEYRIREACRRFNDVEHYGNFTIEAIAAGVGFRSRSNFVTTFKNLTGLTPSAYQKIAKTRK